MNVKEYIELDGMYYLSLTNYHLTPELATTQFSSHIHHELEISCIKSGSGEYLVEGRKYDIRERDIFIFNNIESHAICGIHPGMELVNMVIEFDPRFIWSIESNLFDSRFLAIFFDRNKFFENRLNRDNPTTMEIFRLLQEIEEELLSKPPKYALMIKVKLLNILVALIRHYGYVKKDNKDFSKRKQDLTLINKVIEYMEDNLSANVRLEDLAKIAYMNPSYFSTFFKKEPIAPRAFFRGGAR